MARTSGPRPATSVDYRASWQAEIDSTALYTALSEIEQHEELARVYRQMAAVERRHAQFWADKLRANGAQAVAEPKPSWRTRTLIWMARRFGPQFILPTVVSNEQADLGTYSTTPETSGTSMPADEQSHARILRAISNTSTSGLEGGAIAQIEGRHRAVGGNALRAAVLGANDGLVSNLSLVMGVAGAALAGQTILITGLAGLLAGAGSMALGEWLSVQSSRELYQHQIGIEARELAESPEEEEAELALIYQAKGVPQPQARELAARLISSESSALDTLAREELGVDPDELGGSAWEAAATSFVLFAVGAIIPVLPFIFLDGLVAVGASLLLSAIGLFVIGAGITLLTGRSVLFSGSRQVLFGLLAAALTYAVGRLIGVSIGG